MGIENWVKGKRLIDEINLALQLRIEITHKFVDLTEFMDRS